MPTPFEQPDGPTSHDPLHGLAKLAAVAVIGRDRILELAAKPVLYIWQDIALVGIIVVLAGGPGGGKTTLLFLILAARLNRGKPIKLLGREVTPAPTDMYIILIEAEHGPTSTMRKIVRSLRLLGIDDAALDRVIIVARKSVRIGSDEWLEVGRMVAAGIVSDIALDTLARVSPTRAKADNEEEQVAIFEAVAQTIDLAPTEDTKPTVWTAAHTKKGAGADLEGVSGSTQRVGQADTVLMLEAEKRDGRVTSTKATFSKLREEPDEFPLPVSYTVTKDAVVMIEASKEEEEGALEERILARLALGPETKGGLQKLLKRSAKDIDGALTNLFSAKAIRTTEVKRRTGVYKAFALRTPKQSEQNGKSKVDSKVDSKVQLRKVDEGGRIHEPAENKPVEGGCRVYL